MSRFGPQAYVTDQSGELLARALEQAGANVFGGIERGRARHRQTQLDADSDTDRRLRLYDAGVREGTAPSGDVTLPGLETGADLSLPTGGELARHLSIGAPAIDAPAGSGDRLATALPTPPITTNQPAPFAAPAPPPAPATPGHPGAFDPVSGSFRDGKGMPKASSMTLRNPDRYAQIDQGHYIDNAATPEARQDQRQIQGQQLERELAAQARKQRVDRYVAAGYSPADAEMVVDNPQMADNLWERSHPKPTPQKTKSYARIQDDAGNWWAINDSDPTDVQPVQVGGKHLRGKLPAGPSTTATEKADFQQTQGLQQRFSQNPTVQKAYGIAGAVSGLKAALAGDSPMDDLSVIYETVKLFDPGSVVKEGEVKLARSANSLPGQIGLLLEGYRSGRKLTPEMRQQIQQLLDRKMAESEATIQPIQSEMGNVARRYGVSQDSAYIAPNPFQSLRDRMAPAPSDGAGGTDLISKYGLTVKKPGGK